MTPSPLTAAADAALEAGEMFDDLPPQLRPLVADLIEAVVRLLPDPEPALAPRRKRPRAPGVKAVIRPPAKQIRPPAPAPQPVQASAPKPQPSTPPQPPRGVIRVSGRIL